MGLAGAAPERAGARTAVPTTEGRRMTLEQLRVFVAVAEREHLTRAASSLNIAQSAVSATIAALETEFATRFFDRVGRGLRLTPGGAVLLDEARAVLRRAEEARKRLARFREGNA